MNPELELALELADLAAEIALPRFRDRDFTVTIKSDGSPVTDVDQAVERALRARLAELRPDHAVLGEEYGASGDGEWRWYLDPIDGMCSEMGVTMPYFSNDRASAARIGAKKIEFEALLLFPNAQ